MYEHRKSVRLNLDSDLLNLQGLKKIWKGYMLSNEHQIQDLSCTTKRRFKKKGLIVLEDYTLFSVVCKKNGMELALFSLEKI